MDFPLWLVLVFFIGEAISVLVYLRFLYTLCTNAKFCNSFYRLLIFLGVLVSLGKDRERCYREERKQWKEQRIYIVYKEDFLFKFFLKFSSPIYSILGERENFS
jgi:hypothetical protein